MNKLSVATFSLATAVAVMTLGYATPAYAAKPDCDQDDSHPSCKGDDDGSPSENLSATFCLTIEGTGTNQYILWDGLGDTNEYCADRKEKVGVGTGSGDGFRWDTNMQNINKTQQWMRWRWVFMSIDGDSLPMPPSEELEIDFRFNQTNGLDLGSVTIDGGPEYVAASIRYYAGLDVVGYDFTNYGMLGFGALNAPNPADTNEDDATCLNAEGTVGMIKVTRITDSIQNAKRWTLESPAIGKACRFSLDANGNRCTNENPCGVYGEEPAKIAFDFKFTITQQD